MKCSSPIRCQHRLSQRQVKRPNSTGYLPEDLDVTPCPASVRATGKCTIIADLPTFSEGGQMNLPFRSTRRTVYSRILAVVQAL